MLYRLLRTVHRTLSLSVCKSKCIAKSIIQWINISATVLKDEITSLNKDHLSSKEKAGWYFYGNI